MLKYGFSLPEKFIRPVGEETSKLVEYLSKFIPGRVKREVYFSFRRILYAYVKTPGKS